MKKKTNNRTKITTDSTRESAPPVAAAVKTPTPVTIIAKTTTVTTTEKANDKLTTEQQQYNQIHNQLHYPARSPGKKLKRKARADIRQGGDGAFLSQKSIILLFRVGPHFFRSLKLKYLLNVWGLSRDDWVTTDHVTGSLRHAVGVLTPEDFCAVCEGTEGSK